MALLLEHQRPYMNNNLGPGGYMGQPPLGPPGVPSAFSAYAPPHHQHPLEHNPFLLAAQAAQALTAAHLGLQACTMAAEAPLLRQPLPSGPCSPHSNGSGGASDQSQDGETEDERRAGERQMRGPPPASAGVAGMKIPVVCNDVRGLVYLDQQVVGCYCPTCEARVAAGHDRPLFSFTRFERHCGSKAKKWRLSLRIEPGAVKECPPGDGPMPLGQWMEMRGLISWGARSSVKIGLRESDDDDTALPDGIYIRRPAVGPMHTQQDRRDSGGLEVLAGATTALTGREREAPGNNHQAAGGRQGLLPMKRDREEYDTPDLPDQIDRANWLEEQRRRFEAAAAADGRGGGSSGAGGGGMPGQAGKHGAIFKLVYGLLEGHDRRAFNEDYLPWLNELSGQRLDQEFNTLLQYLQLLSDMPWQAVQGLMRAYLKAILARIPPK